LRYKKVQVLPREYNGKNFFELPTMQGDGPFAVCVDGIDLRFDGHHRCKSNNISMNNLPLGVKCQKVLCVGNFFCVNETCAYKVKYGV
jgi:hypothetical protein